MDVLVSPDRAGAPAVTAGVAAVPGSAVVAVPAAAPAPLAEGAREGSFEDSFGAAPW